MTRFEPIIYKTPGKHGLRLLRTTGYAPTTRSNVAFYGKIEGVKSGAVLASLTPTESTADQGVAFRMYVDRLAEFFTLDRQRVIDSLPACDKVEETGDWAGDIHCGFAKDTSDLTPVISLVKQAMQGE